MDSLPDRDLVLMDNGFEPPRAVLPVGCIDIATRLGVKPQTVMMWVWRTKAGKLDMPSPEWMVSGNPAWQWSTIEEWLRRTGRL